MIPSKSACFRHRMGFMKFMYRMRAWMGLYLRREEIKRVLAEDYQKNKKPSNEFIVEFADKYKLEIPFDLYFDDSALFCED